VTLFIDIVRPATRFARIAGAVHAAPTDGTTGGTGAGGLILIDLFQESVKRGVMIT
jgi:hypothetical protein